MAKDDNKIKDVVFMDGCFDALAETMTQEEIDAFKASIQEKFMNTPIDKLMAESTKVDPDEVAVIMPKKNTRN